eukprot:TRINITY_DN12070_c0_g1_i1.p1 TRINITY_DN12070_c0_g1~~TRINITY_DN12070_c0_g1_i1.p1  ORF type:complete len:125 (+),score=7.52 TRINITY_DN12070_c0_g1_i1:74-448(+)
MNVSAPADNGTNADSPMFLTPEDWNNTNATATAVSMTQVPDDDEFSPMLIVIVLVLAFICVVLVLCTSRSYSMKKSNPKFKSYKAHSENQDFLMEAAVGRQNSLNTKPKTMGSPGGKATLGYAL